MYYSKIANQSTGFTNQIFCFITGIINGYKKKDKVVVVDSFINDISKNIYTPISQIINMDKINIFLKENYDIIVVDKYNINLQIISIQYGNHNKFIDLTDKILHKYYKNNKLLINKDICFNNVKGDPCPLVLKKLIIKYKINNYDLEETYEEILKSDISIGNVDLNEKYVQDMGWINDFNNNMFDNILTHITFTDKFVEKSNSIINEIDKNKKINVMHLRLENDGIKHWSTMNKMTPLKYESFLENKYIDLIKRYLNKNDENIILSNSHSNKVIEWLNKNNYNYKFTNKYFNEREKDAIVDLLISQNCNNIFIGNFNIKNLNGSTFSYYIGKTIKSNFLNIYIDLDKIYEKEVVVLN